jgi:hypothetical protein
MIMRKLMVFLIVFMFTFSFILLLPNNITTVKAFSGNGTGTVADPYQITTIDQLNETNDDLGANYTLMNDIDLSGCELWNGGEGFIPIGDSPYFYGSFDGNNCIISNLFIDNITDDGCGLFHSTSLATIKNLGLINVVISGGDCTGGLIGINWYSDIINCYTTGEIYGNDWVGGLIGINSETDVSNCYSECYVSANNYVGGLIGEVDSSFIINCYATGYVTGYDCTGGLIGNNWNDSDVTSCYTIMEDVYGDNYVGGLIGLNGEDIGGGPVGLGGTITDCYSTKDIYGIDDVGGLIGYNDDGNLTNCYATGDIYGDLISGDAIGGLIGQTQSIDSTIFYCHATGDVIGLFGIGGLTGRNNNTNINCSYATGDTTGDLGITGQYVGGLVGYYSGYGFLSNSYARGDATANKYVGGLVGYNMCPIIFCYSTGLVNGTTKVGGLIGDCVGEGSTAIFSYWDTKTSETIISDSGAGRTTTEMTYDYENYNPPDIGLYENWTFGDDIWNHDEHGEVNDGYPYLGPCTTCNISDMDWSNIIDPIGEMFQDIMGYDENLLGIFILLIFLIMTVMFGLSILIGTVVLIPALFAVFQYIPPLRIIVAIILGLIFGMGLHKLFRR